ncbi:very short patch repair endonuclease [Labrenzia sp. R5_0]|uniref:very short patch repair endonuclease n=1 Tax=Labrenzia sp. R5_0 TaxID=2821108 RepID=UPI001ADCC620|nr:very short patch repair endonuclease [Labrenzia sp. R5_0]MBO9460676.1 DNA mismatch endonuclease Vsr [Labrenzia sp. R5_0]
MDTVDRQTRSRIMASVGQKNTGAEMILRRALHASGFRYRLHDRGLPGSPDLVFPRFHAAVFMHGCYWHAHGCYRSTVPKSRNDFWTEKFAANRRRDAAKAAALREEGWRVLTVWECALKGKTALPLPDVVDRVAGWLRSDEPAAEVSGHDETDSPDRSEAS